MKTRQKQKGGIAVFAILSMTMLLTVGVGVAGLTMQSMRRSQRDLRAAVSFQAAQAGLDYRVAQAFADLEANNGIFLAGTYDEDTRLAPIAPGSEGSSNILPTAGDPRKAWITCSANYDGYVRSVRTYVDSRNVGIWNNAVFAGTGASGRAINGNVDIRGSMHLLGDGEAYSDLNGNGQRDAGEAFTDSNSNGVWDPGEPFTDANGDGVRNPPEPYNDSNNNGIYDPPLTQTDMNSSFGGNAYIGNNYSGMPAALEALVPPPPVVGGLETLGSEVRVKHGRIGISGSATIGYNGTVDGGTSKATIDGSYVNDGYTGNAGAASVFSDNGTNSGYDLGNLPIDFPLLNGIGAQPYKDKNGVWWPNQEAYLNAQSLLIPVASITATTPAFSYGPDAFGNQISFTPAAGSNPAVLNITGVVRVAGDLQIGAKNSHVTYTGNGTLYATQDIKLDGNFLPTTGQVFPTTARCGLIAKRNMLLATGAGSSQLSMAGAFYAQGTIVSAKQNQIAGTFVANYYDLGTNVPNIYQVPSLPWNMPPAMPGDKNYYTLKIKSWRERASNPNGG
jgi:hypothetical protein